MAKEMDVSCDFIEKWLGCMLPKQMMDMLLKVCMKTGEHTFWEDVYTWTLRYRRWNNQHRPFRLLKKRVANIFRKRNSICDNSRGTSRQSIINYMERERSVINDSKRNSVHLDWSDLIPIDVEAEYRRIYNSRKRPDIRSYTSTVPLAALVAKAATVPPSSPTDTHETVKKIVLVPYSSKPKEWWNWQVKKSQLASSTVATPNSVYSKEKEPEQEGEDLQQMYQHRSHYYSPVHPLEFYDDEWKTFCILKLRLWNCKIMDWDKLCFVEL